jgi:hypothetical protein
MERPSNLLLVPCKHMVLCQECANQLQDRGALAECPMCRTSVDKRIRVHRA